MSSKDFVPVSEVISRLILINSSNTDEARAVREEYIQKGGALGWNSNSIEKAASVYYGALSICFAMKESLRVAIMPFPGQPLKEIERDEFFHKMQKILSSNGTYDKQEYFLSSNIYSYPTFRETLLGGGVSINAPTPMIRKTQQLLEYILEKNNCQVLPYFKKEVLVSYAQELFPSISLNRAGELASMLFTKEFD